MESVRILLRPWSEKDAPALFKYAQNPEVAEPAGWPPHESVDVSLEVIRSVFSYPETYAVVLKETSEPIGCCGIVPPGARPNVMATDKDVEIGYWIGKPYWGKGLIPEAVNLLIGHCFETLGYEQIWISCYDTNHRSQRVAEKCGFTYHHTEYNDRTEKFYIRKRITHIL